MSLFLTSSVTGCGAGRLIPCLLPKVEVLQRDNNVKHPSKNTRCEMYRSQVPFVLVVLFRIHRGFPVGCSCNLEVELRPNKSESPCCSLDTVQYESWPRWRCALRCRLNGRGEVFGDMTVRKNWRRRGCGNERLLRNDYTINLCCLGVRIVWLFMCAWEWVVLPNGPKSWHIAFIVNCHKMREKRFSEKLVKWQDCLRILSHLRWTTQPKIQVPTYFCKITIF